MTQFILRSCPFILTALASTALAACIDSEPPKTPAPPPATTTIAAVNETVAITPVVDVPDMTSRVKIETWIDDLDEPWGIAFTAPQTALITQKSGGLFLYKDGALTAISNVPDVYDERQGGLMDVTLDPNWPAEDWVYLSLSHPKTPGSEEAMTQIIRAKLSGTELTNIEVLFQAKDEDYVKTGFHYGSRITFDRLGIYISPLGIAAL